MKVTNMPKHLTREDLSGMLKEDSTTRVLKINVVEADVAKPNHAFVVCPTREAANSVIRCLHERAMGQLSLIAQLHNGVLRMLCSAMYMCDTMYVDHSGHVGTYNHLHQSMSQNTEKQIQTFSQPTASFISALTNE